MGYLGMGMGKKESSMSSALRNGCPMFSLGPSSLGFFPTRHCPSVMCQRLKVRRVEGVSQSLSQSLPQAPRASFSLLALMLRPFGGRIATRNERLTPHGPQAEE